MKVIKVNTTEEIQACFNVLVQLRPHIKETEFLSLIQSQFRNGYQLAAIILDGRTVAVAGFHIGENLAWGKYLYVEDLITEEKQRSTGLGKMFLNWLHDVARKNSCNQLHLDSGIQRKDAHRFYEREGMMFASQHYVRTL